MILLADTDLLLKLAQCDLLEAFLVAFDVTASDLAIVRRSRFSIISPKHRKKLGAVRFGQLLEFLAGVSDVKHDPHESEIAMLTEQTGIDAGEAVLFAVCAHSENCFLATGDKQCLLGLSMASETDADCGRICHALTGRIFCFEQILSRVLDHFGFEAIRESLIRGRECDTGLRIWLGSTLDANEARFREGLTSYLGEIKRCTGNLLAE